MKTGDKNTILPEAQAQIIEEEDTQNQALLLEENSNESFLNILGGPRETQRISFTDHKEKIESKNKMNLFKKRKFSFLQKLYLKSIFISTFFEKSKNNTQ